MKSVVGYTSAELSILFNLLATAIQEALSISITGDTSEVSVVNVKSMRKDLLPAFSNVSLISEAIMKGLLKWIFDSISSSIALVAKVLTKDAWVPETLVPVIGLIDALIFVFGNFIVLSCVLAVSKRAFSVAVTVLPPFCAVVEPAEITGLVVNVTV